MTITITEKEFNAIAAVRDQVRTDYEAASDENYLATMGVELDLVSTVLDKWLKARERAEKLKIIKAVILQKKRAAGEPFGNVDRLARRILRESECATE